MAKNQRTRILINKLKRNVEKLTEKEKERILTDPVSFFAYVTGNIPFEYQAKFLKMTSKRIALRQGRQSGKTTVCAVKALFRAFMNPKQVILIVSPSQRQSSLMFWKIKEFASNSDLVSASITRETLTQMHFDNGSSIHSLPSGMKGTTIMGYSPNALIVDESAYVEDQIYVNIMPSLAATDGDLILISTPWGKRGYFYGAFKQDSGFETMHVKSKDCPLIGREFLDSEKKKMTRAEYLQQYEAEFIAEADAFFTHELIISCMADIDQDQLEGSTRFLAVDFAKMGESETAFIGVAVDSNGVGFVDHIETKPKSPLIADVGRVKELHSDNKYSAILPDQTGMGVAPSELLIEWAEKHNVDVVPITFSGKERAALYKHLKTLMEQHRIWFPKHNKLIHQLSELRHEYMPSGIVRIFPPDKGRDDLCDALAMAVKLIPLTFQEDEDDFDIVAV